MNYAIIAAGEGSRLAKEGITSPKPLVKINGQCLIDRLINIFMDNDAESINVVCNDLTPLVKEHLEEILRHGLDGRIIPLHYHVKTTPSSMHSFYELRDLLRGAPFVLTTVDTIFREEEFAQYLNYLKAQLAAGYDGVMGLTGYIDDEKPLYVGVNESGDVTGFYDDRHDCRFISGGIYGLTDSALDTLEGCIQRGESRMRNFQRALIRDGKRLKAFTFSKVLDIDHASDVEKAEEFIL